MEKTLNWFLIINLSIMLILAGSLCIANYYFNLRYYKKYNYLFEKIDKTEG